MVLQCRDEAINYEPLLEAILTCWKPTNLDINKVLLSKVNKTNGYNEAGFSYLY